MKKMSFVLLLLPVFAGSSNAQQPSPDWQINQGVQGRSMIPVPSENRTVAQAAGKTFPLDSRNNSSNANFRANPAGVPIGNLPPLSNTNTPARVVNAADYGAICNGSHNDTAAIQAALNTHNAFNLGLGLVNLVVQIPQGTCQITAPLLMGLHGSIVGQGESSKLWANYAAWVGTDYNLIEVSISSATPSQESVAERKLSNFTMLGSGNSAIATATAIEIKNTANVYNPTTHAIPYFLVENLQINGFDTGIEAQDLVASKIDNVGISQVRRGIVFNGDVVNVQVVNNQIQYASWSGTSNHSVSIGFFMLANSKYGAGCGTSIYCAPQGITFSGNKVVAFDYAVYDNQTISSSIDHNTLDYIGGGPAGTGAGVAFDANGVGGGIWVTENYFALNKNNAYGVYSAAVADKGLWVRDNYFVSYVTPVTSIGIAMAGSGTSYQNHITGNLFLNLAEGVALKQSLVDSEISENTGSSLIKHMIDLSGSSSLVHTGTSLNNNKSTDSLAVINEGTASGFVLGYNRSRTQLTGSFSAMGAGCAITPGAAGNSCSATITNQITFPDTRYIVTGCAVTGAATHNYVSTVAPITLGTQFVVTETASDATGAGGGTIACSVIHQ